MNEHTICRLRRAPRRARAPSPRQRSSPTRSPARAGRPARAASRPGPGRSRAATSTGSPPARRRARRSARRARAPARSPASASSSCVLDRQVDRIPVELAVADACRAFGVHLRDHQASARADRFDRGGQDVHLDPERHLACCVVSRCAAARHRAGVASRTISARATGASAGSPAVPRRHACRDRRTASRRSPPRVSGSGACAASMNRR